MFKKIFTVFAIALIAFSCGNSTSNQDEKPKFIEEETPTDLKEMNDELVKSEENFDFVLPSPLQIAAIFQRAGLNYVPDITNPISNGDKYNSEYQMSINFGVYSADLSYNVLNNQPQKSIDYLSVVRSLSSKLGLDAIFNTEPLIESFEANINNRDSIVYILGKLQRNLDLYLDENEIRYKSVIFFTGAWVEGMYIGANSIDKRNRNAIANRLVEQLGLLNNLIKGLKNYPNKNEEFDNLIAMLQSLQSEMETVNAAGVEQEDGSIKFNLTDAQLDVLTNKVTEIRNSLIKTN